MRLAFLALLLAACSPDSRLQGVPCDSPCGIRLLGSNDCTGFRGAEARAVNAFAEHYPDVCDRWYGWNAYVQPKQNQENAWLSANGRMVRGLTFCRQRTIQIGTADWPYSSLAHELAHAAECGEVIIDGTEDAHSNWTWQYTAIAKAGQVTP